MKKRKKLLFITAVAFVIYIALVLASATVVNTGTDSGSYKPVLRMKGLLVP